MLRVTGGTHWDFDRYTPEDYQKLFDELWRVIHKVPAVIKPAHVAVTQDMRLLIGDLIHGRKREVSDKMCSHKHGSPRRIWASVIWQEDLSGMFSRLDHDLYGPVAQWRISINK